MQSVILDGLARGLTQEIHPNSPKVGFSAVCLHPLFICFLKSLKLGQNSQVQVSSPTGRGLKSFQAKSMCRYWKIQLLLQSLDSK